MIYRDKVEIYYDLWLSAFPGRWTSHGEIKNWLKKNADSKSYRCTNVKFDNGKSGNYSRNSFESLKVTIYDESLAVMVKLQFKDYEKPRSYYEEKMREPAFWNRDQIQIIKKRHNLKPKKLKFVWTNNLIGP